MHTLNQGQQATIQSSLKFIKSKESEMVIKGPAGTGKTTLVEALVPQIESVLKMTAMLLGNSEMTPLYLTATTNKAANVLGVITQRETTTIHTLLGLTIKNDFSTGRSKLIRKNGSDVIKDSIIIIDEAFFIDPDLKEYIDKCTLNCKIIYIGDPYQCAPVMQLRSPIEDLICREEELTQVMRNKGAISALSEHWRQTVITGNFNNLVLTSPNVHYLNSNDFRYALETAYAAPTVDPNKNKILCWKNDRSIQYSAYIRNLHKLPTEYQEGEFLTINSSLSKQGYSADSVIQIKKFHAQDKYFGLEGRRADLTDGNNLFIPNSPAHYKSVLNTLAKAKRWPEFFDIQDNIPDLRSIHSCTIHKGQGSTYENVFIDLPDIGDCNIKSDVARMMYVATSRPTTNIYLRESLPLKYGG